MKIFKIKKDCIRCDGKGFKLEGNTSSGFRDYKCSICDGTGRTTEIIEVEEIKNDS